MDWGLRESRLFDRTTIAEIQRAAREGIYDIRGFGAKRSLPHFDDLLFLGASMSRYPLEGYRERCGTDVVLGDRFASKPLHLDIPVTIAGMSKPERVQQTIELASVDIPVEVWDEIDALGPADTSDPEVYRFKTPS